MKIYDLAVNLHEMKTILLLSVTLIFNSLSAQFIIRPDTITVKDDRPVYTEKIASDQYASSFVIVIEKEVPAHFHKVHTEYVYVLEGSAEMQLDDSLFRITAGDLIYIPSVTIHSVEVTSEEPLKVISIQSPEFMGKDRYFFRRPVRREENTDEGDY